MTHWRGQDGTVYEISKIEERHIKNCLRMMNENPGWRSEYRPSLEKELKRRNTKLAKALK